MTVSQSNQDQIFYCNGLTTDWSASHAEVHFINIDGFSEGVTG